MRRVLFLGLLLAAVPARAGDFTGFYAGANVGMAFGRERHNGRSPAAASPLRAPDAAADDLPPSARGAAKALHARNQRELPTR